MESAATGREAYRDREPEDVAADQTLAKEEKIRILEDLRLDAIELQTATAENMPAPGDAVGQSTDRLSRIDAALRTLRAETDKPA